MSTQSSQGPISPLLTVDDIAKIARLSTRSVRRLIAERKLKVVRIGRAVRVRPEDLKAFLDANGQERTDNEEKPKVCVE